MHLSPDELERYQRQMMIDGWGEGGQEKLWHSTVFIAGAGGLGSAAAIYLCVAGVGELRICDADAPELSNLNRQILHDASRLGTNKASSAEQTLRALNPAVRVTALSERIEPNSVDRLVGDAAIMVDCLDNFRTRYLLNDMAVRRNIPLVHGAVSGLDGRMAVLNPPRTPCLRCVVPEPPPQQTFPVLGATPGVIGTLQAMETLKLLTGVGEPLLGELLVWDGARTRFVRIRFHADPHCPACGDGRAGVEG
jgi:molybdopterin/thiamine biosynthesis adenylyltransferase